MMGQIALFSASVLATLALLLGRFRPTIERPLQIASVIALLVAVLHVISLLISEDTSYEIVVDHTRPGLSALRRAMGLWGGSEGSLLLFALVIGGGLVIAPVVDRLRAAPSFVIAALSSTSALAASPFERLTNPAIAGSGLSPILEHWAMIIHPPLLYIGLALSLAPALVAPASARRWSAAAIGVLTIALALGGGWAYVELGWGGWYAWDPVENAALIPWLLLVAGQHAGPTHLVSRWTALLVWPTVFCGTAMTRTSLRTSVHAFANSDGLGWALWPLAIVTSIGALLYGFATRTEMVRPLGRQRILPLILLIFAAVVVALGTFRPFIPGEATDGTFYSRFLFPVAITGLVGLGIAPRWKSASARTLLIHAVVGAVVGLVAAGLLGWTTWWQVVFAGAIGVAVVTTIGGGLRPAHRVLAHLGMVFVLAGTLGGTASLSQTHPLDQGESIVVGGHTIMNKGVRFAEGPPPVVSADMTIDGTTHVPAVAVYAERGLRLPEVATHRRLFEDVQVILRSADDDGSVLVTINVEPLTQFVWFGAAMVAIAWLNLAVKRRSNHSHP